MSLSAEAIDALVASGATAEMLAAVVKAEMAANAAALADRRHKAAEKKRRQRVSRSVPGTEGDIGGQRGTTPEKKVSPTPPSKTQTPTPLSPPKGDSSPHPESPSAGEAGKGLAEWAEEIWQAASPRGRQRSSRRDLGRAVEAAVRRGNLPGPILGAVRAYYASADATKDGGEFAKGVHRMVQEDRWQAWGGEPEKPGTTDVSAWSDDRWSIAVERWRMTGRWAAGIGPPPDDPATLVPPKLRPSDQRTAA